MKTIASTEHYMKDILDFAHSLSDMPAAALMTCIILGGFGLAAYAIHAVLIISKGRALTDGAAKMDQIPIRLD